ncbi:DNA helicase RecQ [Guptibacillus hwajinpoensis]|uniref:DNA helicase RecQ n=1 Tax=Guptibacillus hwajinpoensis TaxID=208199 RepID=A0ABU0K2S0_9BACL|nr:DNA helicase RecQ [Alkalihalobacillus hemicentroti]MDQ0483584.1 ATP-dependent DNA helicase RecQ [Alkalihalobacillus hemicentroti]
MLQVARDQLKHYFGYDHFRGGQEDIITSILTNHNTLGIMPTGGGKSICYQIPALLSDGLTIVISPLISLMKDQVDALQSYGIDAAYINSSLTDTEIQEQMQGARNGEVKLLYIAPERLEAPTFQRLLQQTPISLIAVDEAHCISQWGHDFRPSYMKISSMLNHFSEQPPVIALTATATPEVIGDIQRILNISTEQTYISGFARENLHFSVVKGEKKKSFIDNYISKNPSESGIIYAATRKEVDQLYLSLQKQGINVGKYHAGMTELQRKRAQEEFLFDNISVMVATNAFGMGIDKSNVRFVIHHNLPKNMESYYQEAGRAGRDGEPSDCFLLFSPGDIHVQKFLIDQNQHDTSRKSAELTKLKAMVDYCHTEKCLQGTILDYFGDHRPGYKCGKCSNCIDDRESVEITREAQMIFSTIKRVNERFGKTIIAQILKGSKSKRINELRLDQVSTFGLLKHFTQQEIVDMIDFLTAEQFIVLTESKYPTLVLQEKTLPVLKGQETIYKKVARKPVAIEENDQLFTQLRTLRKQIADKDNVPPYVVFADSTLREMSAKTPSTREEMLEIKGVGDMKYEKYGKDFLELLSAANAKAESSDEASHKASLKLFDEGKDISIIAATRGLSPSTIEGHLLKAIEEGLITNVDAFLSKDVNHDIIQAAESIGFDKLKPLKEALSDEITYFQIKAALSKHRQQKSVES